MNKFRPSALFAVALISAVAYAPPVPPCYAIKRNNGGNFAKDQDACDNYILWNEYFKAYDTAR